MNNINLLKMLLTIMGKTESCIMNVNERPGEDKRYALDASKIRTQLGWSAKHLDMRQNLQETIDWYAANVDLWESIKNQVEQHYAASGH